MQTSNAKQNFNSDDPVWVLLAKLSFRGFLSDHDRKDELMARFIFQTMEELGMSPDCMESIARTLAGFAKEALVRTNRGGLEFPERIRIFCQKKIIDGAIAAKASQPCHTEEDTKETKILVDSGAKTIGGWGYFIIERGEDLPSDSSAIPHNSIDLYLYKEGE